MFVSEMKDKNGKDIISGCGCLVDDSHLGIVTGFQDNQVTVLVLSESGDTCAEQLVNPDQIVIK